MNIGVIKMTHVAFDTLKFVEKLETAGIPSSQAKAILEAQREAFEEALDNTLATKLDMTEIKTELKVVKWMVGFLVVGMISIIIKTFL